MNWREEYGAILRATSIPALPLTGLVTFANVQERHHTRKKKTHHRLKQRGKG